MKIIGIGGCNVDILGLPREELALRDSNPGSVTLRAGGVAHNILRCLNARGHVTPLVSVLGQGPLSDWLADQCRGEGLDISQSLREGPACTYLCLHESSGDMLCAINAMDAMEALTPVRALRALDALGPADAYVLDTNLRDDTLEAVCHHLKGRAPLFLDPVSAVKGGRAESVYGCLTALKPNRYEAERLSGMRDPAAAAAFFREKGVQNVFISLGGRGVYYAGDGGEGLCPALPLTNMALLTGAGDALSAGILDALLEGLNAPAAARRGCLWAHEALEE